jgi:hypothetical protein
MFKRARNPHVTNFLRYIDHTRQNTKPLFRRQRSHTRREEPRIPHPDQRESRISERLPQSCPLDWFDPKYFNSMDVEFRALYIDARIALPLAEHCGSLTDMGASPPDWKNMPEAEFMTRYGNAVQAKYSLPTEEELNVLNGVEADLEDVNVDLDGDMQFLDQPEMPPPTELDEMTD